MIDCIYTILILRTSCAHISKCTVLVSLYCASRVSLYSFVGCCNYRTYEPVRAIVTPDKAGKVYKMEQSDHGIWVTFKK